MNQSIEPANTDVISLLREFLKCSQRNLADIFEEIDVTKCGRVTNLEFKEAIRKLQIGLSSREIDDLINATPVDKNNRINYKEFIKSMNET